MKCQHCGINFDDSERRCPVCGERAGSKGRMSVPHYTDSRHTVHSKKNCTHQTFTRDVTFTGKGKTAYSGQNRTSYAGKAASDGKKKGKGRLAIIIAVVFALLELLPLAIEMISDAVYGLTDRFGGYHEAWRIEPEPDYPVDYDGDDYDTPYNDGDYDDYDDSFGFYDLTGGYAMAALPDGGMLEFWLEPGLFGAYQMSIVNGDGQYMESGESWCSYNEPGDVNAEEYPPEIYDCFVVALACDMADWDNEPAWWADRQEMGDLWLLAYQNRETNEVVLEDWDMIGVFGGERFVALLPQWDSSTVQGSL